MTHPPITPLERLHVSDGLLLTADRWQVAHAYHRQRQNLHFQALNQPGIVCGLGVRVIPAPTQVSMQYRDRRWLQVQPGMAIDQQGNPIVVPEPIEYRITARPMINPMTIYLVVRYVDPDQLAAVADTTTVVQETFRLEEQITPPDALDVELCRIHLLPGEVELETPIDCFFPEANQVDLRHRQFVRSRPQRVVRLGQVRSNDPEQDQRVADGFTALLESLDGLYPSLQGGATIAVETLDEDGLPDCDLLYLRYEQFTTFSDEQAQRLGRHLAGGGVAMVGMSAQQANLEKLSQAQYEVRSAIATMQNESQQMTSLLRELMTELIEIDACIAQEIQRIAVVVDNFARRTQVALRGNGRLEQRHPLRRQPFRFSRLPVLNQTAVQILNWGGIVLVMGDLMAAWDDDDLGLSREEIRSAQELGINLLHFAWQRRYMNQGLQPHPS